MKSLFAHGLIINALLLFLITGTSGCGSVNGNNEPPPQENAVINVGQPSRFTNKNETYINGHITGDYKTIICEGGETRIKDDIQKNQINLTIPLKLNQTNSLKLFAFDQYERSSDTLRFEVIQDNIPPDKISSNMEIYPVSFSIDSLLRIRFDSPIKDYKFVLKGQNVADQELTPTISDNASILTLTPEFLHIGVDWDLEFQVADSAGNEYSNDIPFKTYLKLYDIPSQVSDLLFSDLHNKMYLLTAGTGDILQLDLSTFQLQSLLTLNSSPINFAENPDNGNLYVTTKAGEIVVVNPESKTVTNHISPSSEQSTVEPSLQHIAFASNGEAILNTRNYELQTIDTRNGNNMQVFSTAANRPNPFSSNDHNSVFVMDTDLSQGSIYSYDQTSNSFNKIFKDNTPGYIHKVKGHARVDNYAFQAGQGIYFINNGTQLAGPITTDYVIDAFDFTYQPGKDDFLYYKKNATDELGIMDLSTGQILKKAVFSQHTSILGTGRNGNYIFLIDNDHLKLMVVEPKTF